MAGFLPRREHWSALSDPVASDAVFFEKRSFQRSAFSLHGSLEPSRGSNHPNKAKVGHALQTDR
jgi:hypothetical protein